MQIPNVHEEHRKMEEAADRIRSVVKNLLPERPHHLSLYPDRKYQVPPNFWQHQSPLQYSTFISDADRGILLTRPYFDICDEPEPDSTPLAATRNGPKKTLNKMSFKDYKKQKEKASTSPTENGVPGKPDKHRTDAAAKLDRENVRRELDRPGAQRDSKAQDKWMNGDSERYAQVWYRNSRCGRTGTDPIADPRVPLSNPTQETLQVHQIARNGHWKPKTAFDIIKSQNRARASPSRCHGPKPRAVENRTRYTRGRPAGMVGQGLLCRILAHALLREAQERGITRFRPGEMFTVSKATVLYLRRRRRPANI